MFNVVRPLNAPPSLANQTSWRGADVITALRNMFHNKCYICEQASVSDPEVEHFVPHGDDPLLMYGWDNLFFSCRRCNGIKSSTHINLLNCTDATIDVFEEIIHFAGNASVGEVEIRPASNTPSQQAINTANLIRKCFNDDATELRKVSKESLLEELNECYVDFMLQKNIIASRKSIDREINDAKERIAIMCRDDYPFSVFWKWHIIKDPVVIRKFPNIRDELGF
ncbi:MAG: hypothetical protein E6265_16665 [Enterobacteriaceae bacterium]|nr:hypothetical protein [Enterobacteriaceae bacterium]